VEPLDLKYVVYHEILISTLGHICLFLSFLTSMDQLRTVHKLTMKMKREVVLGSSSIDDPPEFISVNIYIYFILFPFLVKSSHI
jgi:hypothetical protein